MKNILLTTVLLIACISSIKSQNQFLGIRDSTLVKIDASTGHTESLYTLDSLFAVRDMTQIDSSSNFYVAYGYPDAFLAMVDACTGTVSNIVEITVPSLPSVNFFNESIAYDNSTGKLYGALGNPSTSPFRSNLIAEINPITGDATIISTLNMPDLTIADADGMTFISDTMYVLDGVNPGGIGFSTIYSVDIPTGNANELGSTFPYSTGEIAYDDLSDTIYAIAAGDTLVTIDRVTYLSSLIGPIHPPTYGNSVKAIDFLKECDCQRPYGLESTVNPSAVALSWKADPKANLHQLRGMPIGSSTFSFRVTPDTSFSINLGALTPDTTFIWSVRSRCTNGATTPFSVFDTFSVMSYPMAARQSETQSFFPTSTTTTLTIDIQKSGILEVFEVSGRIVHLEQVSIGTNTIELEDLNNTLHFVRIDGVEVESIYLR